MSIIWRILRYVKPYWKRLIIAYITLFLALAVQLIVPEVLARAIDNGIVAKDEHYLVMAASLIIGLTLVQGVFTFIRSYLFQYIAVGVANDLRNELYARLETLSFTFYDRSQTGQLMSRATDDITNIRGFLMMGLRATMLAVATLITVTIILFRTDALLAAVSLAVMPLLAYWSIRFGVTIRPIFLSVQQQFGVMTSALQENVAGSRVVRAFAQESNESERFESELQELFQRNLRAAYRWAFNYPLTLLMSGIGLAGVLWLGGYQVINGSMSIGTLVAFNRYLTLLADPIRWIGFVANRVARAIASGERIFEILDTKPGIAERPGALDLRPIKGEVVFDDVTFYYHGAKRPALANVSFMAKPGESIALIGPTGSGKSTIISLLPRFYDVTSGKITIDGHDVRDLTLPSLREQVGTVLQETFLFSLSIRENIAFGRPDATFDEVVAAAKAAQAHDFIMAMPEGYNTKLGERGVTVSGGQKQRIAIARALLKDPRILVLDEATSSVDTETEHAIQQAMKVLMQGRTSFIIAQRLTTVQLADQILVFDDGKIIERGTHAELLEAGGFYRQLYDLQMRDQEEMRREALLTDIEQPDRNGKAAAAKEPTYVQS